MFMYMYIQNYFRYSRIHFVKQASLWMFTCYRSHAPIHDDRIFAEQCARFDIHYRDGRTNPVYECLPAGFPSEVTPLTVD